jgi:hypothetical protein
VCFLFFLSFFPVLPVCNVVLGGDLPKCFHSYWISVRGCECLHDTRLLGWAGLGLVGEGFVRLMQ